MPHTQLTSSLNSLVQALESNEISSCAKLRSLLTEADIKSEELLPWANYDHPVEDSYGRKVVYENKHFEVMVMSWTPGDMSAIHNHGNTQWGCVQVFGQAEHATFKVDEDEIYTLSRETLTNGQIIHVNHSLVHQMGNSGHQPFLSLHVYGIDTIENASQQGVTADSNLFYAYESSIARVGGGAFFALPQENIETKSKGPKADFPTYIRDYTEHVKRLRAVHKANRSTSDESYHALKEGLYHSSHLDLLTDNLEQHIDENGHCENSIWWKILYKEIQAWSTLKDEIDGEENVEDSFHDYAAMYDALIGNPCLEDFMANYIAMVFKQFVEDAETKTFLSLGCGTGLIEEYILENYGITKENLFGFDLSHAMVDIAKTRIQAEQGDVLDLDPAITQWDIAFTGLNVLHYIDHELFEESIQRTASIVRPGGFFFGDFITPDHIRWYPNLMRSSDSTIISLRNPKLKESEGRMYMESHIINLDFSKETVFINDAGSHLRHLPAMHRVRALFEKYFTGSVHLYDAYSLREIAPHADSCASTRYFIVAKKKV
ncbi:MAG: methyltransferase domain-containing protein [Bacteroidota bacterium]|nr:methyltransferase domain-containing protein [Bacteroidota bacterium]